MDESAPSVTRRRLLGGVAGVGAGTLAGCSERLWTVAERSPHEQVSLTIKALPAEYDVMAATIAGHLETTLTAAGIDAGFEPIEESELYRQTLINADFDVFVVRHPGYDDPDALRGLLHSAFINERGWQNPFRFSDAEVDELLERQCESAGGRRRTAFGNLFSALGGVAPFTTVAFPDRLGAANEGSDLTRTPRSALEYYELLGSRWNTSAVENDANGEPNGRTLRVVLVDQTVGDRLNPIAVDVRDIRSLVGLLYDPLVRRTETGTVPWLAERVEWDEGDTLAATVTLREGLTWHDGLALEASDVVFTVGLLADTARGQAENEIPAPRYRERITTVDDVAVLDDRRVRFTFDECARPAAERVLTVPILPEHVWAERATVIDSHATEAVRWDNDEPVGSGLYAFAESGSEYVRLEPYDDHVLHDVDIDGHDGVFDGIELVEDIEFRVTPNIGSAIDALGDGEFDFLASYLTANQLESVEEADGTTALHSRSDAFYMVGYNLRHPELTLPQFRRVVSRLIDREFVASEFFDGYAQTPTTVGELLGFRPDSPWDLPAVAAGSLLEFPGTDGEVDEAAAHALFEEAGYHYDNGDLVA
ncbi:ABC transporter substrate-binding protein [Natronobiforma cellulositropha]|uniref:ABC transporter substrate-binding protein n=1 Tax=Natronobiforma cellulositropha TaxID=1679076 RepID=UPI0021D59EC2|nr:ABC transporter substrate-binding protein [Natronobiforma cellulositropha]